MDDTTFVGLDVNKATVSVAVAEGGRGGEVRHVGVFANRADHIGKMADWLAKVGRRLSFCLLIEQSLSAADWDVIFGAQINLGVRQFAAAFFTRYRTE